MKQCFLLTIFTLPSVGKVFSFFLYFILLSLLFFYVIFNHLHLRRHNHSYLLLVERDREKESGEDYSSLFLYESTCNNLDCSQLMCQIFHSNCNILKHDPREYSITYNYSFVLR